MKSPRPPLDPDVTYQVNPPVNGPELNALFAAAWPDHTPTDFGPVLSHSLVTICARYSGRYNGRSGDQLVGFINLAWDGGRHAFILDTTVHPAFQRRGIGRQLVQQAITTARNHQIEWLHVDYEPHLHSFYRQCGFEPTQAGLINLRRREAA
jgi:GNAT superfamily N-acetyltransferase